MYLEDVNIEGFKSFSEKTNMSFQPGIGVIIGNNGVGKSSLLNAGLVPAIERGWLNLGATDACPRLLLDPIT